MPRDVPADAVSLCDKAVFLSVTINGTVCSLYEWVHAYHAYSVASTLPRVNIYLPDNDLSVFYLQMKARKIAVFESNTAGHYMRKPTEQRTVN